MNEDHEEDTRPSDKIIHLANELSYTAKLMLPYQVQSKLLRAIADLQIVARDVATMEIEMTRPSRRARQSPQGDCLCPNPTTQETER
ncbi:MAG: hypothetical protein IT509_08455 [Rhodocyclaceae bacterium]|nr:hypothetical protein [Rhodocyclaceae bacterium]